MKLIIFVVDTTQHKSIILFCLFCTTVGQIGFQLSNDGTNEMQYGKSNYYSFQHPHEGSNQIPLFIRPRTYGNNVSSGQIMSRVKIVVMYN